MNIQRKYEDDNVNTTLQLESTKVIMTETTEGVDTKAALICPLKKPLPHPQNYMLSLECPYATRRNPDCGYAKICFEGESVCEICMKVSQAETEHYTQRN